MTYNNPEEFKMIPEHEAKDRILAYLVKSMPNSDISFSDIHLAVFPAQDVSITAMLMLKIEEANEHLIISKIKGREITHFYGWFTATALTKDFLNKGGFTQLYHDSLQEEREYEIRKQLEEKSIQDTLKTNRSTRRTNRINTTVSISALIVSLLAIAISLKWLE